MTGSDNSSVLQTLVTAVHSSRRRRDDRTARLLRTRLRSVVFMILTLLAVWLVRSPFVEPPAYEGLQVTVILLLGTIALLLSSTVVLGTLQLRLVEGMIFGATMLRLVVLSFLLIRDRAGAGHEMLALAELYNTVIAAGALLVVYGMLVPNTWQRALAVMIPLAAAPLLEIFALRWLAPGAFAMLASYPVETLTDLTLIMTVSIALAACGTQIIYSLRRAAAQVRELGQYLLEERIATGGMGEIWRASHRFLARPAAIKVIHPERIDPSNPEAASMVLQRFEQEAQATAMLESLHTVRIYDFGRTDTGDFYYAMELLQGLDLESLVKKHGPVGSTRAIHFLLQACDSLAEAHAHGQVHRDIKPSNLFVCIVGRSFDVIKVLDFGLVTRAGSEATRDMRLAEDEEMAGTPAYMAPEQVLAVTSIDHRVDVYALGCVAYWLLTGHTVFDIDRPMAVAVAHVKAKPMPPSRRTEIPIAADFERIVLRCLAKEPDDRPASAEELADLLRQCEDYGTWSPGDAQQWWQDHGPSTSQVFGSGTAPSNSA